jgi:hypothetical protein
MWQFLGHACKITNIKRESEHYVYVWEVTAYSCKRKRKNTLSNKKKGKSGWDVCEKWHHKFYTKGHPNPKPLTPAQLGPSVAPIFHPFLWNRTIRLYIYQKVKMILMDSA